MQKILDIALQKKINNFLYNAYFLCVTLSRKNLYSWFYERYMQLYYNPSRLSRYGKEVWLDFFGGWSDKDDVLTYTECDRSIFNDMHIIDFIESNINAGCYIYAYIDEYYLKPHRGEQDEHLVHDIFVYGYDKENKQFLVIGFDEEKNFCNYAIDYKTFETSFIKGLELTEGNDSWKCYGFLIHCKYNREDPYEFKLSNFLTQLHEYLYSVNSGKTNISSRKDPIYNNYILDNSLYGMSIYDELLKYLSDENAIRRTSLRPYKAALDYRIFHTLYEHKTGMSERLNYIADTFDVSPKIKNLAAAYTQVEQGYKEIKFLAMKYLFNENERIIPEIASIVGTQAKLENQVLSELYALLSGLSL